jgi:hypothetical protein
MVKLLVVAVKIKHPKSVQAQEKTETRHQMTKIVQSVVKVAVTQLAVQVP